MISLLRKSMPWLLAVLLVAPTLAAQSVSYNDQLRLYEPTSSGELGLFTAPVGQTLQKGDWSFHIYENIFDFLAAPATSDIIIPSRRKYADMDVTGDKVSLGFGYGLTDRWEIYASIPYVLLDQNEGDRSGFVNGYPYAGRFDDNGWGDFHLGTKIGLLNPNSFSRLALSLSADIPMGSEKTGISTGSTNWGIGLHWNRGIWSAGATYGIMGERSASDNPLGYKVSLADEARLDAGLNIPVQSLGTTNWISEINSIFYSGSSSPIKTPREAVYVVSGFRHWFGTSGWAMNIAARANITEWAEAGNHFGGLIGLTYSPMHLTPPPPPPPPPPAPVAPPPPPPPPAPVTPPHQPVELHTEEIHFESGSARVTNIAKAILDDVALRMKQEPTATAIVTGYTDGQEKTGPNADLDRRRAESVRDYLVSRHGIDASRITIEAKGTENAPGDNATSEGRMQNRRVVVRLVIP